MTPPLRRLLAVALTAGLLLSTAALATTPADLPELRDELSQAEGDLAATEAALQRAEEAIARTALQVERASTHLAQVQDLLADARTAHADAAAAERVATAAAADANRQLEAQVDDHQLARERLRSRAVQLHKHGPFHPGSALLRGVTASEDWHEVAVTLESVSRVVAHDRGLVATTAELTREIVDGRDEVVRTRQEAITAARRTAAEQRHVTRLVEEQQRALERLEEEHTQHAQVLADLESDAEVRAALVTRLSRQIAQLELDASLVLTTVGSDLDLDRPAPAWSTQLPGTGNRWAVAIDAVAEHRGVDPLLLAAVVWTESNFAPTVVSHAGAIGLAQLMPGTAAGLRVDPWDPVQNLDGGARYLRTQLEGFGSIDLALAAYNAGPNRVRAAGPGIPNIVETQLYVVRVLDRYQQLTRT